MTEPSNTQGGPADDAASLADQDLEQVIGGAPATTTTTTTTTNNDHFLKIDGIEGESLQKGHEK
jgi:hypothetical protein